MARIGMNPARHRKTEYKPQRVTVAMLIYLPHLSGYFKHRFDVLKLSIGSLLQNTHHPFDFLVFDNDSCDEVKKYLRKLVENGHVRYLLTSGENIGKLGALRLISGAIPGEVLAYTDDDTFFYPGWLGAHLEILDSFPKVGMVSGSPERTLFDHGISSNLEYAAKNDDAKLSYGKTIPEQWEREWAFSLGKDVDKYLAEVRELEDIILIRGGDRVYATACHNQFVMPKSVAVEFLQKEWSGRLMGGMNELDNSVDEASFLRLTTLDRTTRLIGNLVSSEMKAEARKYSIDVRAAGLKRRRPGGRGLTRSKPVRWLLQGIYNRLFGLLSDQSGGWYSSQGEDES
jgi:glycosyltransferase involved in cell wall biosynthesis